MRPGRGSDGLKYQALLSKTGKPFGALFEGRKSVCILKKFLYTGAILR